jgi:hypothetical protein
MKALPVVLTGWIALGVTLGAVAAHGFQFGGRDTPFVALTVSADERTLAVHLDGPGLVTVEETTTTVRLRAHETWFVDVDPEGYSGAWTTVRLAAPLGHRTIIDETTPAHTATVPRPAWLPPGYAHCLDSLAFAGRSTAVYTSSTGGVLTITESTGRAAKVTEPAELSWTNGDYTFTIDTTTTGGVPVSVADLNRIEASVT